MQALFLFWSGIRESRSVEKLVFLHQHSTSNVPEAATAHSFALPHTGQVGAVNGWSGNAVGICGLTFELSGRQRQDARPGLAKMYRVPPDRAWWPAVGAPLERVVRRQSRRASEQR